MRLVGCCSASRGISRTLVCNNSRNKVQYNNVRGTFLRANWAAVRPASTVLVVIHDFQSSITQTFDRSQSAFIILNIGTHLLFALHGIYWPNVEAKSYLLRNNIGGIIVNISCAHRAQRAGHARMDERVLLIYLLNQT